MSYELIEVFHTCFVLELMEEGNNFALLYARIVGLIDMRSNEKNVGISLSQIGFIKCNFSESCKEYSMSPLPQHQFWESRGTKQLKGCS